MPERRGPTRSAGGHDNHSYHAVQPDGGAREPAREPQTGRVWTREGLTPEQLAAGQWRCRWVDEAGVAHDVLAIPVERWDEAFPMRNAEASPRTD